MHASSRQVDNTEGVAKHALLTSQQGMALRVSCTRKRIRTRIRTWLPSTMIQVTPFACTLRGSRDCRTHVK